MSRGQRPTPSAAASSGAGDRAERGAGVAQVLKQRIRLGGAQRVEAGEPGGHRHGARVCLAGGHHVERRVSHEHRAGRLPVARRGALARHGHEVGPALVRVGAVGARLEVEPAIEPERADLHRGVGGDVAGEERLHHAIGVVERGEHLGNARVHPPLRRDQGLARGEPDGELLEHGRQVLVRVVQHLERDLVIGAARVVHPLGNAADDLLERLLERMPAVAGGVHQRAVDVP
jgi:hypothetical protein